MPVTEHTPQLKPHISRRYLLKAAVWASVGLVVQACTLPYGANQSIPPPIPYKSPTPAPTPTLTASPTPTPAPSATPLPEPTATATVTPEPTLPSPDPELIRPIGKNYPLPPDFRPSELHSLVSYPFIQVQGGREGLQGHPEAAEWLSRLFEAARQAGILHLYLSSAYRSTATQAYLWETAGGTNQIQVAPPGTSEHHSGLAFDFTTVPISPHTDSQPGFDATPAGLWLRAHAHRFGFVCTYTRPGIDGISPESWHYRYVGVQTSTQLYELGYLNPTSTLNPIEFYAGLLEKSQP